MLSIDHQRRVSSLKSPIDHFAMHHRISGTNFLLHFANLVLIHLCQSPRCRHFKSSLVSSSSITHPSQSRYKTYLFEKFIKHVRKVLFIGELSVPTALPLHISLAFSDLYAQRLLIDFCCFFKVT